MRDPIGTIRTGRMMRTMCFFFLVGTFFSGCAAGPHPQIYHLGIMGPPVHPKPTDAPLILLEHLSLPRHLDRPQMVTRDGMFQILIHEHHRWAAPMDRLFRESLASRLDTRLSDFRVIPLDLGPSYPPPALRIRMQMLDFSGDSSGEVRLCGIFSLHGPGAATRERPFDIRVFAPSAALELLPSSLSLAMDGLAQQLVAEIREPPL